MRMRTSSSQALSRRQRYWCRRPCSGHHQGRGYGAEERAHLGQRHGAVAAGVVVHGRHAPAAKAAENAYWAPQLDSYTGSLSFLHLYIKRNSRLYVRGKFHPHINPSPVQLQLLHCPAPQPSLHASSFMPGQLTATWCVIFTVSTSPPSVLTLRLQAGWNCRLQAGLLPLQVHVLVWAQMSFSPG
ncbi:hypothetical protein BGZ52_010620, partial [Haplosporangium bisporale]